MIVVGSSNTDLVVRCDRLPRPGETILGGDFETYAGGKGANQSVAAARAGAEVHFIGAFGDDEFGRARRADLEREGIDCSGCVVKQGVPSGVALIAVGAHGKKNRTKAENQILVAPGANARLTPADVRRGMPKLRERDVVLCSLEVPLATAEAAIRLGKRQGSFVILNPAPVPTFGLSRKLLRYCNHVTPNESEFEKIIGAKIGTRIAVNRVSRLVKILGPNPLAPDFGIIAPEFIVTRGAQGVDIVEKEYFRSFVSAPKVNAIDSTGAGDCFNGSMAAALARNENTGYEHIPFAVAAAAIKVTRRGAQAAMPYRHEILKMLKRMKTK